MFIDLNKPNGIPIKITEISPREFRSDSGYIFSIGQHSASFVNEKTGIFLNLQSIRESEMSALKVPNFGRPIGKVSLSGLID